MELCGYTPGCKLYILSGGLRFRLEPILIPKEPYVHTYAYMLSYMLMKRTALFLKQQQLEKLQKLSEKTGAPVAELIRRSIDAYLLSRKKELK